MGLVYLLLLGVLQLGPSFSYVPPFQLSSADSYYRFKYRYIDLYRYLEDQTREAVTERCTWDPKCICFGDGEMYFIHCEMKVHVSVDNKQGVIEFQCNRTLGAEILQLELPKLDKAISVTFNECPEPRVSYVSLFDPPQAQHGGTVVRNMEIYCRGRKSFQVAKQHFEGLDGLEKLAINCPVLSHLPSDLFHGTPVLQELYIAKTLIEHIPRGLFQPLKNVNELFLHNNRFKRLQKDVFTGLTNLSILHIRHNNLKYLEDGIFEAVANIVSLDLSYNNLTVIPRNMSSLSKLISLDLRFNLIEEIRIDDLAGIGYFLNVYLGNNTLASIDNLLFSGKDHFESIDVSNNAISRLPEKPVTIDSLYSFKLNGNSKLHLHFGQFLRSQSLVEFQMSRSNVDSLQPNALHEMPSLETIDLSDNNITSIHDRIFAFCSKIEKVFLQQNGILSISAGVFEGNVMLKVVNLSSNSLKVLPDNLFRNNSNLLKLDLSVNSLETFPEILLANTSRLIFLNLSQNNLLVLENDTFVGMPLLLTLDLSQNKLDELPVNLFLPHHKRYKLRRLHLQGNRLTTLPRLWLPALEYLDLGSNMLEKIRDNEFHALPSLRELSLYKNRLKELPRNNTIGYTKIYRLDLSYNKLQEVSTWFLLHSHHLLQLDLSGNDLRILDIGFFEVTGPLQMANMSNNRIENIIRGTFRYPSALKVLDLSNNLLKFIDSPSMYDKMTATWGSMTPLVLMPSLEELYLSNNSISTIFLDWRIELPNLRLLDLSRNKFEYLTHQEMLFATAYVHRNGTAYPYPCSHELTVDLRWNNIKGLEMQTSMMMKRPPSCKAKKLNSHAIILLDHNPILCGCGILNLLRVLENDLVLTSELYVTEGKDWILPARLDVGNLSCWEPVTVRGKRLIATEEWMHHLISLAAACVLGGYPLV